MSNRFFVILSLASLILLLAMMNFTTPADIGPLGVLVFFTLVYAICLGLMVLLCRGYFSTLSKMKKRPIEGINKKSFYYGSVLAFAPILMIFMRSFGGLNFLEVFLIVLFVIISCFYISKKT